MLAESQSFSRRSSRFIQIIYIEITKQKNQHNLLNLRAKDFSLRLKKSPNRKYLSVWAFSYFTTKLH